MGDEARRQIVLEEYRTLWEEYKYRHELCWKLIFRVTASAVVLSVVPYVLQCNVLKGLGKLVLLGPALAIGLIVAGSGLMIWEGYLFYTIDRPFADRRLEVFGIEHRPQVFPALVGFYLFVLLALSIVNYFVAKEWLTRLPGICDWTHASWWGQFLVGSVL